MDCPRLGAVLHTTGLWGRSYIGVGRRAASRTWQKLCHREDTGLPWGKHYHGRIHIWDYPKGNQAIRTPSPVQGLTGDPGELTPVLGLASVWLGGAESNCAREPARQAGQREPRLQMLCKRLQRHNRHTCGGAAKGSRGGWHRRRCVLRHPHRTPWVPNGTGQRCVGRNVVPEPYSLGYWQNGSWARVRRQGVAHCHPMDLRTRRKRKLLFLWEGGYLWQKQNETKDSPPGPPPGEGAALFSPSPEKEQTPTSPGCLSQGRFVDFLDDLGPGWDAGGRRSPARGSTHRPMCRFGLGRSSSGGRRRAPTVMGRLRPGPGGNEVWCITPGQDVLDRLSLLLYRRELYREALDGVAEQPSLGDGGVEKVCLVDVLHLCQVEPEMVLLDHHGGHRRPEGPRRDFRRS